MKTICGIYKIECKITKEKYVGQSIDIKRRWQEHKTQLEKNLHYNYKLQEVYNVYGKKNLKFSIIEKCDKEHLNEIEQRYIDAGDFSLNVNLLVGHGGVEPRVYKDIILISSDGRVFTEINNLSEFCRENDLTISTMHDLLNNHKFNRKSHKGWELLEDYNEPDFVDCESDLEDHKEYLYEKRRK